MSVVSAIFWGIVVLSLLVFIHEGGHYLASRACGVRVTEFYLGMPCRIKWFHKSRDHGTELGVTPILLGGYTRICGMEPLSDDLLASALMCVQRHGRVSVHDLAEEIGCDEERAYGLMAQLTDWASIRPYYNPELGEKPGQRDWPAAFETLRRDANMLTEYDHGHDFTLAGTTDYGAPRVPETSADDFLASERSRTYLGKGFWQRLFMLAAGPVVNLALAFVIVVASVMAVGVTSATDPNTLAEVEEGSYAEAAGLQAGDTIVAINDTQTGSYTDIVNAISPLLESGTDFEVTYERDGQQYVTTVDLPDGESVDMLGIGIQREYYTIQLDFPQAVQYALSYGKLVATYAVRLIMPQYTMDTLNQSSSIVGVSVMASEAASMGALELLLFIGAISMSLGFMNLLPIPPLDGGKILIEIIQLIARRDLSLRAQTILTYAGLAFFVFVFVVVLKNDISRFVIG